MNVKDVLSDKGVIDILRLLHRYLHELENQESCSSDKFEKCQMKDKVEFILRDSEGKIKQIKNG